MPASTSTLLSVSVTWSSWTDGLPWLPSSPWWSVSWFSSAYLTDWWQRMKKETSMRTKLLQTVNITECWNPLLARYTFYITFKCLQIMKSDWPWFLFIVSYSLSLHHRRDFVSISSVRVLFMMWERLLTPSAGSGTPVKTKPQDKIRKPEKRKDLRRVSKVLKPYRVKHIYTVMCSLIKPFPASTYIVTEQETNQILSLNPF